MIESHRRPAVHTGAMMLSYPRRQQYRRLARAGVTSMAAATLAPLALLAVASGMVRAGVVLLLLAIALGVYTRHWVRLSKRAGARARHEHQVQQALATLAP